MRGRLVVAVLALGVFGVADAGTQRRTSRNRRAPRQAKRVHIPGMRLLNAGKPEEAAAVFRTLLAAKPTDEEALYGLAAAGAQSGDIAGAVANAKKAVAAGLPVGRFLAGPRAWFGPLLADRGFQQWVGVRGVALAHGPMVGCVTDRSARFWVRTATAADVQVVVGSLDGRGQPRTSPVVRTRAATDFTAVAEVEHLAAGTTYSYGVLVDGKPTRAAARLRFRTFPGHGAKARFQVGFGGGAGYTPAHERMWDTIRSHSPLAFLLLGDNVYIDLPKLPNMQRYCYYRRQSRPEFRRFVGATAIYAIWDDHDFGANDCVPGPDMDAPPWKRAVWRVFRNNWNNPAYGGGEVQPGCWFDFTIGDVDFFMTDGRYYRSDPRGEHPSMLGPVQRAWLLDRLKASKATFKVLVSGTPWAYGTKPGSLDTWEGFRAEREAILAFIQQNRIGGIILLSADRHRSDVWRLARDVGYPLYEFESSRLTNMHRHRAMKNPKCLFSYNAKQSFGLLTFDTTKPDPEIACRFISIDDEVVHTVTLTKSQLTPR